MSDERQFEAGVFALTADGWKIAQRRTFDASSDAVEWARRTSAAVQKKDGYRRVWGSVVPARGWVTLEVQIAEYETRRKAGDPEYCEPPGDDATASPPQYTRRQGQFLAFIYYYTKLNKRPPAEADFERYFHLDPPTVHNTIITLHRKGLIERDPRSPRSIRLLVGRAQLPDLE